MNLIKVTWVIGEPSMGSKTKALWGLGVCWTKVRVLGLSDEPSKIELVANELSKSTKEHSRRKKFRILECFFITVSSGGPLCHHLCTSVTDFSSHRYDQKAGRCCRYPVHHHHIPPRACKSGRQGIWSNSQESCQSGGRYNSGGGTVFHRPWSEPPEWVKNWGSNQVQSSHLLPIHLVT